MLIAKFLYIPKHSALEEHAISIPWYGNPEEATKQKFKEIALSYLEGIRNPNEPIEFAGMMKIPFCFKKVYPDSEIPIRMHEDDAGYDLFSYEDKTIYPQEVYKVHTGIMVQLPPHAVGFICPRSGLALKKGISIVNAPGTIDSNYRGEVIVILRTIFESKQEIKKGERIAQFVPNFLLPEPSKEIFDELIETDRGTGGFGSTDKGSESESSPIFHHDAPGTTDGNAHGDNLPNQRSDESDSGTSKED